MVNIEELLFELCEDENVYNDDYDLMESGLMDSFAFIEMFSKFEDYGIELYPTQIDRERLRTPGSIKALIEEYYASKK